ncbi:MAG: IS1380 family transposase [Chloroflexota bacterium]
MAHDVEQTTFLPEEVFAFEIERTDEPLVARGGLVLPHQMAQALGLPKKIDQELPPPGSGRGLPPSAYVMALLLMLHGGGRALEDLRDLQGEVSLRRLLKMRHLPASCTVGDWLRRMGVDGRGLEGLGRVNGYLAEQVLARKGGAGYTLDVDGTIIESEKAGAQWTYKKVKGYQPVVGFVQESEGEGEEERVRVRGLVIEEEFRDGNVPSGADAVAFLERCRRGMPAGKRLEAVRLDSAWYQAAVFNWSRGWGLRLVVCADQDVAVKEAVRSIGEGEWRPYRGDREIAETVHTMDETEEAFRLVVVRWPKPQPELFDPEPYFYHVLATNGEEQAEEVVEFYNQRGEVENWIKELKDGFGMEWMPCGETYANAVFFRLGVMAYNLFLAMKLLSLPKGWHRHTVGTVRWRLYQIAGRVVWEARRAVLMLATAVEKMLVLLGARRRIRQMAVT